MFAGQFTELADVSEQLTGVDRDALVLIDNPKSKASEADRYVASSRAKHLLTVVNIEP